MNTLLTALGIVVAFIVAGIFTMMVRYRKADLNKGSEFRATDMWKD